MLKDDVVNPELGIDGIEMPERVIGTKKSNAFVVPVGDVLLWGLYYSEEQVPHYVSSPKDGYEHRATTQLWYISPEKTEELKREAGDWVRNGFKLCFGKTTEGTNEFPGVITQEEQQRGVNMPYAASSRGVGAYVGDKLVWLEIKDTEMAYEFLLHNTDIPCAVRCDLILYTTDKRYKQVFDIANDYFQTYYCTRIPKSVKKTMKSERERLIEMYDL